MRRVLAALFAAGVAKGDVQTQDVSVSKSYPGNGYSADNSVSVTIRQLAKAGSILDAASSAGANDVFGPTLTRSDQDGLQAKALRKPWAMPARRLASSLTPRVRLGSVTAIIEGGNEPMPVYEAALAQRSPSAPIEPGKQQTRPRVRVTFAIG